MTRAAMANVTDEQLQARVAAVVRPEGEHVSSEGGPVADYITAETLLRLHNIIANMEYAARGSKQAGCSAAQRN